MIFFDAAVVSHSQFWIHFFKGSMDVLKDPSIFRVRNVVVLYLIYGLKDMNELQNHILFWNLLGIRLLNVQNFVLIQICVFCNKLGIFNVMKFNSVASILSRKTHLILQKVFEVFSHLKRWLVNVVSSIEN